MEVNYLNTIRNILFSLDDSSASPNCSGQEVDEDNTKSLLKSTADDLQNLRDQLTDAGAALCAAVKEQVQSISYFKPFSFRKC